jgi:hypothetical protein
VRWLGVGAVGCGSGYVYHAMKVMDIVESPLLHQNSLSFSCHSFSLPNRRTVFTIILFSASYFNSYIPLSGLPF